MIKRREFIFLGGGAAVAWPLTTRAQQADGMRRVGMLSNLAESDPEAQAPVAALHQALAESGWVEGRNLRIDHRCGAGDPRRLPIFAKELLGLQPDVVIAQTTPSVIALRKETDTVPIVFVQISDPIGAGFITNLARPGGNITGFTNFESLMCGKWVEMLKEIAPGVTRVALMFNPETAPYVTRYYEGPFEVAAPLLGVLPSVNPVHDDLEIESAITALAHDPGGGLILMPDGFNIVHRERIITLAARHKLPAIYPYRFAVTEGALLAYGVDLADLFRRTAAYIDRILKGAKPADLPVQAPVKFEMAINLKTAKVLGLIVPPGLLVRADEVIE
jgi:putative tryptophan/tyrosine transport system substrate-binding protein